ncbi:MAG: hypothetical protein HUU50_07130 [Candidatus Brocadiae bacterium]|nr:hypothetical protein [Candidatus Brocadiia bacterium]
MEDEIVKEETGEYADTYQAEASDASGDGLSVALVVLTAVFLFLSIAMIAVRLYTAYDLGKSEKEIMERERSAKILKSY